MCTCLCVPVGSTGTLALDQYHRCQADLARDPDSAPPGGLPVRGTGTLVESFRKLPKILRILWQTVGTTKPHTGRPRNAVLPTIRRISPDVPRGPRARRSTDVEAARGHNSSGPGRTPALSPPAGQPATSAGERAGEAVGTVPHGTSHVLVGTMFTGHRSVHRAVGRKRAVGGGATVAVLGRSGGSSAAHCG